jgi:DNA-binding response OmpR family regulator
MFPAKVLVVDDEPSVRFFLKEVLTRDGHQVVAAESGEAALAYAAAEEFQLALLDLKMEGLDGLEVMAALKRQHSDIAVIVLTAYASLETAVDALRKGAYDYLFKPCKTVEIRESVRTALLKQQRHLQRRELVAHLERSLVDSLADLREKLDGSALPSAGGPEEAAQEEGRFTQHGDLIVDFMRHVITCRGHLLELSPTEFDVLAYLISEAPRVVPAEELAHEAQGYAEEVSDVSSTVRYHIYRLRRKIKETTGRSDVIHTVRGVGYTVSEV